MCFSGFRDDSMWDFLLSKSFSSFSSLTTVKTLWTLTSVLCWPPTLQSVQLWHLYLPFSRKLDSQLNKNVLCLFMFIYYQSALTRSPLGMRGEMFTLELLANGFMGDIIQLQILIYGRDVMNKLQLPAHIPTSALREELLGINFYFPESGNLFLMGNGRGKEDFFSLTLRFFWKRAGRMRRSHHSSVLGMFFCPL